MKALVKGSHLWPDQKIKLGIKMLICTKSRNASKRQSSSFWATWAFIRLSFARIWLKRSMTFLEWNLVIKVNFLSIKSSYLMALQVLWVWLPLERVKVLILLAMCVDLDSIACCFKLLSQHMVWFFESDLTRGVNICWTIEWLVVKLIYTALEHKLKWGG